METSVPLHIENKLVDKHFITFEVLGRCEVIITYVDIRI